MIPVTQPVDVKALRVLLDEYVAGGSRAFDALVRLRSKMVNQCRDIVLALEHRERLDRALSQLCNEIEGPGVNAKVRARMEAIIRTAME